MSESNENERKAINKAHNDKYKEYRKAYYKARSDKYKAYYKEYDKEHKVELKKYKNQLCCYNGEVLKLYALVMRFKRAGIEHPTLEAKKYLIETI